GKSMLGLDLAARVSRGAAMPLSKGSKGKPAEVVLYSGDDGLADTVRPRLEAAGADLNRVHAVEREISAQDVAALGPRLIVLDPIGAYLCLSCEPTAREVIRGLSRLARETGAAVLAIHCLPEIEDSPAAAEIYGAARTVLEITRLPNDSRRLALKKSNLRHVPDVQPLV